VTIVPAVVIVSAVVVASAVVVVLAVVVMVWLNSGCFEWEVTSASIVGLDLRSSSLSVWIARKGEENLSSLVVVKLWTSQDDVKLDRYRSKLETMLESFEVIRNEKFRALEAHPRTFARQWKKSHVMHIH
jgi:hypothetical protein